MFSIIVAFDKNQVIGKNNKMPWHYKEDLAYFKKTTLGKKVVMGSNTFKSIVSYNKEPLPNRENIVISSKCHLYPNIECYCSIEHFLEQYQDSQEEIFIIGGASIFEQLLPYCDRLYITHIDKEYDGDTYFPPFNYDDFTLISENKVTELTFAIYERKVTQHV